MNKRTAKALRQKAADNTKGQSVRSTIKEYKRLKNKYKDIKQGKV